MSMKMSPIITRYSHLKLMEYYSQLQLKNPMTIPTSNPTDQIFVINL